MKRRGRPPLAPGESSTNLTITVPVSWYDRMYEAASRDRVTVPEIIRRTLRPEFSDTKSENPTS